MKKILYLGDNPDSFLDLIKKHANYRLQAYKTIEAAVSAIASQHFHLGIVDCQSALAGADFVHRVRLERRWNAPIIFIATYPIVLSRAHLEAFTAGKIQFIEKPYDYKALFSTIQKCLYVDFDRLLDALELAKKALSGSESALPQFAMKAFKSELDYLWELTYEVEGRYFKRLLMKLKTAVSNLLTEDNFTLEQLKLFEQGIAILKEGEVTEGDFYSFSHLLMEAGVDTMVRPKTESGVDRLLEMYDAAMIEGEV
ncbi:MAG: hypothetical protein ACE5PV_19485 [Candidatus Poribacteria bacterium]